jgi:hypothetical protein
MTTPKTVLISLYSACFLICSPLFAKPQITLESHPAQGQWSVQIDGKDILTYCYGPGVDLPHYWPLNSPSGKNLLIQKTDPYPHHRSLWFADTVQTAESGRKISFYNALYSGVKGPTDTTRPTTAPYKDHIRHIKISTQAVHDDEALVKKSLIWEYDHDTPLLDEDRKIRIKALGQGEYLLDIRFSLTATYGDVDVVSDAVHYAWPYLRINPIFSGEQGGTITSDNGATGQAGTHNKVAHWIDYSNTVEGVTEGLTVFQWPDGKDHRWLTREYGTFGPRRPDNRSGKAFTIKKGESIHQRIGILVHRGDVRSGRANQRYQAYISGKL